MSGEDIPHHRKTMGRGRGVVCTAEDTKQAQYLVAHGREFLRSGAERMGLMMMAQPGFQRACLVLYRKPRSQMEG